MVITHGAGTRLYLRRQPLQAAVHERVGMCARSGVTGQCFHMLQRVEHELQHTSRALHPLHFLN